MNNCEKITTDLRVPRDRGLLAETPKGERVALVLAWEPNLAAAFRTEVDRKMDLAAENEAIVGIRISNFLLKRNCVLRGFGFLKE